jgi:hypothetical protein
VNRSLSESSRPLRRFRLILPLPGHPILDETEEEADRARWLIGAGGEMDIGMDSYEAYGAGGRTPVVDPASEEWGKEVRRRDSVGKSTRGVEAPPLPPRQEGWYT